MVMLLLVFITCSLVTVFSGDSPVVESPAGMFKGISEKSSKGTVMNSFLGIPYAKPPLGSLRLKDPVKMSKLNGTYEAIKFSESCYQPAQDSSSGYLGSEDCLYLNIHVPKLARDNGSLPVLVWIHGGGWYVGKGAISQPEFLLDRGVIFVSMNYRLGILGFLSGGDSVIPGNYGMKDQVMALKWVQENIASFGGDPNSVTLGGESSGGVSSSLIMHSPLSKGLMHRVISQSGTAYEAYAVKPWPVAREATERVASFLACPHQSQQLLKCLQEKTIEDIFKASKAVQEKLVTGYIDFPPVLEDPSPEAFITKHSWNQPSQLPSIVGVTSREALFVVSGLQQMDPKFKDGLPALKPVLREVLPLLGYYSWLPNKEQITDQLASFYFGPGGITDATEDQIINLISDIVVNYAAYSSGTRETGSTYMYIFSYIGSKTFHQNPPQGVEDGVPHAEDLIYLNPPINLTKQDKEMSEKMIDMWYNFVRFGDPTPRSKIWKESEGGKKYIDMTNNGLIMKTNMFHSRMEFLHQLNIDRSIYTV